MSSSRILQKEMKKLNDLASKSVATQILDHEAYGPKDVDIRKAAKSADVLSFIMGLPQGYELMPTSRWIAWLVDAFLHFLCRLSWFAFLCSILHSPALFCTFNNWTHNDVRPEFISPIAADGVLGFNSWLASATGAWIEATDSSLKVVESKLKRWFQWGLGVEVQLT